MTDTVHRDAGAPRRRAPNRVGSANRELTAPRSREFRDTQSLALPLDRVCGPEDPHVRIMRLRETAVRGTLAERTNFLLNEVCVQTPDVQHVLTTTDALLELSTVHTNPGGMLILADGGMGKDALIRFLSRRYPPHMDSREPRYPLLTVRLQAQPHAGGVLKALLDQMQCVYRGSSLSDMKHSVLMAMDSCENRGVIFNEAHQMVSAARGGNRATVRLLGEFGDWLKEFADDIRRPLLLFGIPGWEEAFLRDGQFETRISHCHRIREFDDGGVFLGILKALDEAIPMPQPAGLAKRDLADKLFVASRRKWRHLIFLLRDAVVAATKRGSPRIEEMDLHWAYCLRCGTEGNPFDASRKS